MKIKAARLYGANDIRIEEFDIPEIKDDQILIKVISNSICMSTYKAAKLGPNHKRVPEDIATNPIITGHEFAGEIAKVGGMWKGKFNVGDKFVIQPALFYKGSPYSPGYSYKYFGGNATYAIVPWEYIEYGCLLKYEGDSFCDASLSEPMSCIIGAYHANFHTKPLVYKHEMGIKEGGNLALLASAGPMGIGAIDYAIHRDLKPKRIVVVDIDDFRLNRAKTLLTPEYAKEKGIELIYVNTSKYDDPVKTLMDLTDGRGYDDVFVFAPVRAVVELGDDILGHDGCLNIFAGSTDKNFKCNFNYYKAHYMATHVIGTSGGSIDDMKESLEMTKRSLITPSFMITHVGGIDVSADTILNLPNIPGGKKIIYPHIQMPLLDLNNFDHLVDSDERYKKLNQILNKTKRVWSYESETFVLNNF